MSNRNLLASAQNYLDTTSNIRIAHLVTIELAKAVNGQSFAYLTDYFADIYDPSVGKTFLAGRITRIGDLKQDQGIKHNKLSITIAGEFQDEVDRALVRPGDGSYVGNSITVTRAFMHETNGSILPFDATTNGPMEYFKGQLTDANIKEDVTSGSSTITYSCADHFEDFTKVNGRLTDDVSHRGLTTDNTVGSPTYGSLIPGTGAKKTGYRTDRGFQHANSVSHISAKYMGTESQLVEKSSFFGLSKSYSIRDVPVQKSIDLNLNLAAKYLPVIYGVRKTSAFPIFADIERDKPSSLWVVYAVCEGEIDGLLDIYINNSPALCFNNKESQSRECVGNMMSGHTMANFSGASGAPTTHGQKYTITKEEGKWEFWVYHGKSTQTVCPQLSAIASTINLTDPANPTGGFLLQTVPALDYWGTQHTLLDTAYVVMRMDLTDDQVQAPKIEPVVQGKRVEKFNASGTSAGLVYSLNPVWHLYDYITSFTYGGGLSTNLVDTKAFATAAGILDTVDTSYEAAWIDYWRYIGWTDQASYRKVLECNTKIDTDVPVFKNLEGLVGQMDASLLLLGGKYKLSLESSRTPSAHIDINETLNSISAKDASGKDKWNSITAQITDPAKAWQGNSITFFNSEYKLQDNNIDKKGNANFNQITNYYTARAWAERSLNKSRFSRDYTITTYFKYIDIAPNDVVEVSYSRWNMVRHKLIVTSITIRSDGLINLSLKDYDEKTYDITKQAQKATEEIVMTPALSKPQGLVFENYAGTEPHINGVIKWSPNVEPKIDAYDVWVVNTANSDSYVSQDVVPPTQLDGVKMYSLLRNLVVGSTYIVQVRARGRDEFGVNRLSGWSYLQFSITQTVKMANVEGLKILNLEPGHTSRFVGKDVKLQWTPNKEGYTTSYTVEVVDPSLLDANGVATIYGTYSIPHVLGLTLQTDYTHVNNKIDFARVNSKVGIYRNLKFRIKAQGTGGEISASWVMTE